MNSYHPGAIRIPILDPDGTGNGPELAKLLRIAATRVGEPLNVANASPILASYEAPCINGAELTLHGGSSAGLTAD